MEKTQINSEVAKGKLHGADGKKLSKKEREAAFNFVMDVKSQIDGYFNPMFAEKAVKMAEVTADGDTLHLHAEHVVKAGDSVDIVLVRSTKRPKTAHITTEVDGSPVDFVATFAFMEYGPNYVESSTTKTSTRSLSSS